MRRVVPGGERVARRRRGDDDGDASRAAAAPRRRRSHGGAASRPLVAPRQWRRVAAAAETRPRRRRVETHSRPAVASRRRRRVEARCGAAAETAATRRGPPRRLGVGVASLDGRVSKTSSRSARPRELLDDDVGEHGHADRRAATTGQISGRRRREPVSERRAALAPVLGAGERVAPCAAARAALHAPEPL